MRSPFDVLDPVAELSDSILVVVAAVLLLHEVVAVGEDFGFEAV